MCLSEIRMESYHKALIVIMQDGTNSGTTCLVPISNKGKLDKESTDLTGMAHTF